MLKTKKGSPDGIKINEYLAGQNYDMSDSLANVFVNQLQVAEFLNPEIEIPEKAIEIEIPEKLPDMEAPMKTIKKKRGRPKKVRR